MGLHTTEQHEEITALIRVWNSEQSLPSTLQSLARQQARPRDYVFVDSGSIDRTLDLIPSNSVLHRYVGDSFNYAAAINQGLRYVDSPLVLIISSHTTLANPEALSYAVGLLAQEPGLGAAYFTSEPGELRHSVVDSSCFDGFNGLWNTCALVWRELLDERAFRPEVFAAEDQEWARWLFHERGLGTARIAGAGMCNESNPRLATSRSRLAKWRREYLAIAIYVRPEMLRFPRLFGPLWTAIAPRRTAALRERGANAILFLQLLAAKFKVDRSSGHLC